MAEKRREGELKRKKKWRIYGPQQPRSTVTTASTTTIIHHHRTSQESHPPHQREGQEKGQMSEKGRREMRGCLREKRLEKRVEGEQTYEREKWKREV